MNDLEHVCDFGILRELRKNRGMSIAELSAASGVAESVISKLERNRSKAELDTLYRIAKVFGLTLTDLVSLAENRISHCVNATRYTSGDFTFDRVDYGNLRCMHAVGRKGDKLSRREAHSDDYELCWVLRGKLHFQLPGESRILSSGMSIQFDALLEHTYEALEACELVIIHLRKEKRF
ncbi:MAG: helix-turn-helix domain-containing protein [Victivallaceae bacterium]|nr:helix-turn-helix domain-containing protein [Victivallaceae bacterium]